MARCSAASLLFACSLAAAQLPLEVDETRSKVVLRDNQSAVSLAVRNAAADAVLATVALEWLEPDGRAISKSDRSISIPPGQSDVVIDFPLPDGAKPEAMWRRLRYRIRREGEEIGGTLALAQVAAHLFELRLSAPAQARPGEAARVRVTALHPVFATPVAGVLVLGVLDLQEETAQSQAVTGQDGLATLELRTPQEIADEEVGLTVEGVLGDFRQAAELELKVDRRLRIRIDTDKPLYQPGQTLHLRLLCLTPAGRAAAGLPVEVRVEDPEDTAAFITRLVTNRFGVAAADWQIPDNTRLGDYRIRALAQDEDSESQESRVVKISRYELPSFTVTVKPDRKYYLPGQNAVVEARAEYLFGKPVPRGRVRLVRETRREWDYRAQKWDIDEGETQEGVLNAGGRFAGSLNLAEAHDELTEEGRHRFRDLSYTAYVRDLSSGRTEQRRFDIRVTRDPIHVYLIEKYGEQRAYVSTSYADGTPASCRIRVNSGDVAVTNRYGLGRIQLPEGVETLELAAADGRAAIGYWRERIYRSHARALQLHTDKTLYRGGEPILVTVISQEPLPAVALQILREGRLIDSQWLDLRGGRTEITIPWRPEFTHEVTIGVTTGDQYDDFASRTVLFPANRDLDVRARADRTEYRPGEEAVASFEVHLPDGKSVESALGVVVVDTAVGERVRTDADSRGGGLFLDWSWYARTEELAGITRRDLYRLDTSKPFPEDLDLLAEVMLANDPYWPNTDRSADYWDRLPREFDGYFVAQFKDVRQALKSKYEKDYHHPLDEATLKSDLREAGINFDALRDPWEQPYRAAFGIDGPRHRLRFLSAGPDKQFGTSDDLVSDMVERAYFQPVHDAIDRVLAARRAFPKTEEQARTALIASGIDPRRLRDPWGAVYSVRFRIARDRGVLEFRSAGPDRAFGTPDDFRVDAFSGRYFLETEATLANLLAAAKSFPRNEREWNRLLLSGGLFPLRDPWGRRLYAVLRDLSRYTDLERLYTAAKYGSKPRTRVEIVPATETSFFLHLRSAGEDGKAGTKDDFDLASFSRVIRVETAAGRRAEIRRPVASDSTRTGSIVGRVTDPTGAVVPGVTVRAVRGGTGASDVEYTAQTDSKGLYLLGGLLPGFYDVRIEMVGFRKFAVSDVPVDAGKATVVDATLEVGTVSEAVVVAAEVPMLETEASSAMVAARPGATPRLREYFPETLLWAPSVETGSDGRAEVRFRLADNITTWKLEAIGSTMTGETGTASIDIRAFQPFFVDHDPPRVLTQGDEIQLPVTVRNYLDQPQKVELSVKPEKWFELTGGDRQEVRVAAGASGNIVFPLRAVAAVERGGHRVTATSGSAGDAIEKPVSVHPDGEEVSETSNVLFSDSAVLRLDIPETAIAGSARAELKIYPNLISHVIDGIEGILQRPYGCAEQTISSAYPGLLLLRYLKQAGQSDHPLSGKAQRYLRLALDRLPGYGGEDGGFSYWGRGDSDVHLTAYALKFLTEAVQFAEVDGKLATEARECLLKKQGKDGEWPAYNWKREVDQRRTLLQTAEVALVLGGTGSTDAATRALRYLATNAAQFDEPYLIAVIALVAQRAGDSNLAAEMREHLRRLARRESGFTYWHLESNTPFYGWGLAGRLETSALALRALNEGGLPSDSELTDSGLLFLLRNKDRYGVWWSTQATFKVLEAILETDASNRDSDGGGPAEIVVNDRAVERIDLPPAREISGPLRVDLSRHLSAGSNVVTLRRMNPGPRAQAQLVASHYVPWPASTAPPRQGPLSLRVIFDKTALEPGDAVTCRVEAERVGFRGYGMMLAEIGLPPGADVERQSLEAAMASTGYSFSRYDILPDRVVAYLWPAAGGVKFDFRFRPRFAMKAKAAAARMFDYYNPEASVVVAPVLFRVERRLPRPPQSD